MQPAAWDGGQQRSMEPILCMQGDWRPSLGGLNFISCLRSENWPACWCNLFALPLKTTEMKWASAFREKGVCWEMSLPDINCQIFSRKKNQMTRKRPFNSGTQIQVQGASNVKLVPILMRYIVHVAYRVFPMLSCTVCGLSRITLLCDITLCENTICPAE